jgi:hypothetical protein
MKKITILLVLFFGFHAVVFSQERETASPVYIDSASAVPSSAMSKRKLIQPEKNSKYITPEIAELIKSYPEKVYQRPKQRLCNKKWGKSR